MGVVSLRREQSQLLLDEEFHNPTLNPEMHRLVEKNAKKSRALLIY